jgi:hypothetical protein
LPTGPDNSLAGLDPEDALYALRDQAAQARSGNVLVYTFDDPKAAAEFSKSASKAQYYSGNDKGSYRVSQAKKGDEYAVVIAQKDGGAINMQYSELNKLPPGAKNMYGTNVEGQVKGLWGVKNTAIESAVNVNSRPNAVELENRVSAATQEIIKAPAMPQGNQDVINRLEVVEYTNKSDVYKMRDPQTGKEYYAKPTSVSEIETTRKLSNIQLPDDSPLCLPKVLENNGAVPPALSEKINLHRNQGMIITEAVPHGDGFNRLLTNSKNPAPTKTDWKSNPITSEEYDRVLRDVKTLNENGVFHRDTHSNTEFSRGQDGKLRVSIYDFEPRTYQENVPHCEDYAVMVVKGEELHGKGIINSDAEKMLSRHGVQADNWIDTGISPHAQEQLKLTPGEMSRVQGRLALTPTNLGNNPTSVTVSADGKVFANYAPHPRGEQIRPGSFIGVDESALPKPVEVKTPDGKKFYRVEITNPAHQQELMLAAGRSQVAVDSFMPETPASEAHAKLQSSLKSSYAEGVSAHNRVNDGGNGISDRSRWGISPNEKISGRVSTFVNEGLPHMNHMAVHPDGKSMAIGIAPTGNAKQFVENLRKSPQSQGLEITEQYGDVRVKGTPEQIKALHADVHEATRMMSRVDAPYVDPALGKVIGKAQPPLPEVVASNEARLALQANRDANTRAQQAARDSSPELDHAKTRLPGDDIPAPKPVQDTPTAKPTEPHVQAPSAPVRPADALDNAPTARPQAEPPIGMPSGPKVKPGDSLPKQNFSSIDGMPIEPHRSNNPLPRQSPIVEQPAASRSQPPVVDHNVEGREAAKAIKSMLRPSNSQPGTLSARMNEQQYSEFRDHLQKIGISPDSSGIHVGELNQQSAQRVVRVTDPTAVSIISTGENYNRDLAKQIQMHGDEDKFTPDHLKEDARPVAKAGNVAEAPAEKTATTQPKAQVDTPPAPQASTTPSKPQVELPSHRPSSKAGMVSFEGLSHEQAKHIIDQQKVSGGSITDESRFQVGTGRDGKTVIRISEADARNAGVHNETRTATSSTGITTPPQASHIATTPSAPIEPATPAPAKAQAAAAEPYVDRPTERVVAPKAPDSDAAHSAKAAQKTLNETSGYHQDRRQDYDPEYLKNAERVANGEALVPVEDNQGKVKAPSAQEPAAPAPAKAQAAAAEPGMPRDAGPVRQGDSLQRRAPAGIDGEMVIPATPRAAVATPSAPQAPTAPATPQAATPAQPAVPQTSTASTSAPATNSQTTSTNSVSAPQAQTNVSASAPTQAPVENAHTATTNSSPAQPPQGQTHTTNTNSTPSHTAETPHANTASARQTPPPLPQSHTATPAPTHAPSPAPTRADIANNYVNKGSAVAGIVFGGQQLKDGVEKGDYVEAGLGGGALLTSAASFSQKFGSKAGAVGLALGTIGTGYQTYKIATDDKLTTEEKVTQGSQTFFGGVAKLGANALTLGHAGNATDALTEGVSNTIDKQLDVYTTAYDMAVGKEKFDVQKLIDKNKEVLQSQVDTAVNMVKSTTVGEAIGTTVETTGVLMDTSGDYRSLSKARIDESRLNDRQTGEPSLYRGGYANLGLTALDIRENLVHDKGMTKEAADAYLKDPVNLKSEVVKHHAALEEKTGMWGKIRSNTGFAHHEDNQRARAEGALAEIDRYTADHKDYEDKQKAQQPQPIQGPGEQQNGLYSPLAQNTPNAAQPGQPAPTTPESQVASANPAAPAAPTAPQQQVASNTPATPTAPAQANQATPATPAAPVAPAQQVASNTPATPAAPAQANQATPATPAAPAAPAQQVASNTPAQPTAPAQANQATPAAPAAHTAPQQQVASNTPAAPAAAHPAPPAGMHPDALKIARNLRHSGIGYGDNGRDAPDKPHTPSDPQRSATREMA